MGAVILQGGEVGALVVLSERNDRHLGIGERPEHHRDRVRPLLRVGQLFHGQQPGHAVGQLVLPVPEARAGGEVLQESHL